MNQMQNRMPGVGTEIVAGFRSIWVERTGRRTIPGIRVLDGALSRDPGNTGYLDTLRAGMLMGKVTSGSKYAPAVIGTTALVFAGTTSIIFPAAVAVEINRRLGATGSFKLTGPPAASGVVRTASVGYSAVNTSTGVVAVTSPGTAAVWTLVVSGAAAEKVIVEVEADANSQTAGVDFTTAVAWNGNSAVMDAALEALSTIGPSQVAATTTATGGEYLFTFTHDMGDPRVRVYSDAPFTLKKTTAGVDGRFVTGSLVQPVDGSETIRGILDKADGEKVTDDNGTSIDIQTKDIVIGGGVLDTSQIINVPADASTLAWLKAELKDRGGPYVFDDDV